MWFSVFSFSTESSKIKKQQPFWSDGMICLEIHHKPFERNCLTMITQAIEVASSLHYQDFERGVMLGLCFTWALLIEVLNKISRKNFMLYIVDILNVWERNAFANIHRSMLHMYHLFITLRRRQKPLKHLSNYTPISEDNPSACAYYVERGF